MTIVLQHRFWDLIVSDERFEVKLTFDGIPERLVVPFAAIKVFFDPSVPYGLQFEGSDLAGDVAQDLGTGRRRWLGCGAALRRDPRTQRSDAQAKRLAAGRAEKKAAQSSQAARRQGRGRKRATGEPRALPAPRATDPARAHGPRLVTSKPDQPEPPANDTKVVQLDKFRKK